MVLESSSIENLKYAPLMTYYKEWKVKGGAVFDLNDLTSFKHNK